MYLFDQKIIQHISHVISNTKQHMQDISILRKISKIIHIITTQKS